MLKEYDPILVSYDGMPRSKHKYLYLWHTPMYLRVYLVRPVCGKNFFRLGFERQLHMKDTRVVGTWS